MHDAPAYGPLSAFAQTCAGRGAFHRRVRGTYYGVTPYRRAVMHRFGPMSLILLAACSPQVMVDQVGRRAAESVVMPVMATSLPSGRAQAATTCIVQNATASEVQALARDVGVVAGTLTRSNIATIAARPETQACFAAAGVPMVG